MIFGGIVQYLNRQCSVRTIPFLTMNTNNTKSAKGAKSTKSAAAPAPEQRRLLAGGAVRVPVSSAAGSPAGIPKARTSGSYEEISLRQQSMEKPVSTGPALRSAARAATRDERMAERERQAKLTAESQAFVKRLERGKNVKPKLYNRDTSSPAKTDTDPGQAKTAAPSPAKTVAKSVQAEDAPLSPVAVGDKLAQDASTGIKDTVDLEISFDADELPRYDNLDKCIEEEGDIIEITMRNLIGEAQRVSIQNEKLEMELARKDELVNQLNDVCDDRDALLRKNEELKEATSVLMSTFEEKMREQEKLRRESELREQELALARQEQERLRRESELRDKEIALMRELVEKIQAERTSSEPLAVHCNSSLSVTNVSFDSIYATMQRDESASPPMHFRGYDGSAFEYPQYDQANTSNALVFSRKMTSPRVSAVQQVGDVSSYVSPVMSGKTSLSLDSNLLLRFGKLFSAWNGVVAERIGRQSILARHLRRRSGACLKQFMYMWRSVFKNVKYTDRKLKHISAQRHLKILRNNFESFSDFVSQSAATRKQFTQAMESWSNRVRMERFRLVPTAWRAVKTVHSRTRKFLSKYEKDRKLNFKCRVWDALSRNAAKSKTKKRRSSTFYRKSSHCNRLLSNAFRAFSAKVLYNQFKVIASITHQQKLTKHSLSVWHVYVEDTKAAVERMAAQERFDVERRESLARAAMMRLSYEASPTPYVGYPPSAIAADITSYGRIPDQSQMPAAMESPNPAIRLNFVSPAADNSSPIVSIESASLQTLVDSAAQVQTVVQATVTTPKEIETTHKSEQVTGVGSLEFHNLVVETAKSILDSHSRTFVNLARRIKFPVPLKNWTFEEVTEKYVDLITRTSLHEALLYEPRPINSKLSFGQSEFVYLRSLTCDFSECQFNSVWNLRNEFNPAIMALIMSTKKLGSSVWVPDDDAAVQASGGGVAMAAATVAQQVTTQQQTATQQVHVQQAANQQAAAGQQTVTQTQAAYNTIAAFDEYGRPIPLKFKRY